MRSSWPAAFVVQSCALSASSEVLGSANTCDNEELLVTTAVQRGPEEQSLRLLQVRAGKAVPFADGDGKATAGVMDSNNTIAANAQIFDDRCLTADEGSACIPDRSDPIQNPRLWTHIAYCSGMSGNRYRLGGITSCASQRGANSRCKMTGMGLTRAQCDDPFCRQRPDGNYCYRGDIVLCKKGEEPQRIRPYCTAHGSDPVHNAVLWTHLALCRNAPMGSPPDGSPPFILSCAQARGALSRCMSPGYAQPSQCDDPLQNLPRWQNV